MMVRAYVWEGMGMGVWAYGLLPAHGSLLCYLVTVDLTGRVQKGERREASEEGKCQGRGVQVKVRMKGSIGSSSVRK